MKDPRKLKELILEKTEFSNVLQDYGAEFVFNPSKAEEVQLRCPFHGNDRKPSARFYKETQSMFCWVCHKRWDVIEFIIDKENASFIQALNILVRKYQIDTSSIPDDPEFVQEKVKRSTALEFQRALFSVGSELPGTTNVTIQTVELPLLKKEIRLLRGKIFFKRYNALSGVLSMIQYALSQGLDSSESIIKLREKLQSIG